MTTIRPGGPDDSRAVFDIFLHSVSDLGARLGLETITGGAEAAEVLWEKRRSLFEHAAGTSERWWVAVDDGALIGYARSTRRDGVRQLTEFFVRPGAQSGGVGRELLSRTFPADGARGRILLATPDPRALTLYLRAGLVAHFPVFHFHRERRELTPPAGLTAEPLAGTPADLEALGAIDQSVLGFRRDADHRWLLSGRQGFLYRRGGQVAGYGYVGGYAGPFAALAPDHQGPMLAHAESVAPPGPFGVEVPLINRAALDYLLAEGFRMDPFVNYFMSDGPPGRFDRYLVTTPSFFI